MSFHETIKKINASIEALYSTTSSTDPMPIVCISCDRFVCSANLEYISTTELKERKNLFHPNQLFPMNEMLKNEYTLSSSTELSTHDHRILSECMLSPRALYVTHDDLRRKPGFTVCTECKTSIQKKQIPLFSIANNFAIGETPTCLLELTDVELAMITPIKTFGYCFSYTGGLQKQLKGSLSYYKISTDTIVRTGAQLEAIGLNNHVIIVLYGSMTAKQRTMAMSKYKINTAKVITAIKWLLNNNIHWIALKKTYKQIRSLIKAPLVLNRSRTIQPQKNMVSDPAVECTETFQVFYPDGTVSVMTGGQQSIQEFQKVVQAATKEGFDIEMKMSVFKEAVHDYKDSNLVQASLTQFPYGFGGLNDSRFIKDSKIGIMFDIVAYTTYLSMLSLTQFHKELFTLQMYNMQMKFKMLNSAIWRVRDKLFSDYIGSKVTCQQIDEAIDNKRNNRDATSSRGSSLLGAIDAVCKAIPHTNEAAKVARRDIETMQHHFGCPTFFLTVTPDDDNHILIQIYSQNVLSATSTIDEMTDDEVFELSKQKTELRIKFPGICAYFFELMIDIVLKDVIGWDVKNKCRTTNTPGLFGDITAVSVSVEEQGRRTLHAHILLWDQNLNELRTQLYTGTDHVARQVKNEIITKVDTLSSTGFFFDQEGKKGTASTARMARKAFPHPCATALHNKKPYPTVVSNQQLRHLRCKRKHDNVFTFCAECSTTWTPTEMVCSYLQHHVSHPKIGCDYKVNIRRLKNKTTEFQLHAAKEEIVPMWIVDAAYNHHVHTSSCFKHKFGVDKTSALCDECRYRYPQLKRLKTTIQDSNTNKTPWFLWSGKKELREIKELYVRRSEYNLFQNICCPQISYSKLTCNTNISFLLPGPVAQYCVGYTMKNTQDDELQEYELVPAASEKILSKVKDDDTSRRVAIRRLIGTSFVHQSNNIVGAAMASYLTRNGSRFHFSHSFTWCPLRDLDKLLHGEKVHVNVSFTEHQAYFHCLALHYLCRPKALEHLSVFDFYPKYEVRTTTKSDKTNFLQFNNTRYFRHPSFNSKKKQFGQCLQESTKVTLPKVFQYDFPDSATFEGDILHPQTPINSSMEQYSKYVLLLFHSFRKKHDLMLNKSYTQKLRDLVLNGSIKQSAFKFLQNLQDSKSNNLRNTTVADELQRITTLPSHLPNDSFLFTDNDDSSEGDDEFLHLNDIFQQNHELDEYIHQGRNSDFEDNLIPSSYNCNDIINKGGNNCGTTKLPNFANANLANNNVFCTSNTPLPIETSPESLHTNRMPPTQSQLVSILFTHNNRQRRSFTEITGQKDSVSVYKPNGSAKSIIDWAVKSNFDSNQRRAFEVIAGSFVLAYYDTATSACKEARASCKSEAKNLRILVHNDKWKTNQLICFLHGPGGSGKSAVIDLAVLYSRSFCKYLWSDFNSSERVIAVTALTGVAATLLQGETTHAALHLNQKKDITREQVERWAPTRMVIIDEISFASKQEIAMINTKLRQLKQQQYLQYGGINIVFSGDFRQLEPVGANKLPIYDENVPQFRDWVNCYIELNGLWRFKDDIHWGKMLQRIRNGKITSADLESINAHLLKNTTIPHTVRYATYFNVDRDSINTGIFHARLKAYYSQHTCASPFLLVFSDEIYIQDSSKVYKHFNKPTNFWEKYGENDVKMTNGRMDPVLKLYFGCSVMLPTNINVASGQANGTQATVEQVILKQGQQTKITEVSGIPVPSVFASQIHSVHLRHSNTRTQPETFIITPKNAFIQS